MNVWLSIPVNPKQKYPASWLVSQPNLYGFRSHHFHQGGNSPELHDITKAQGVNHPSFQATSPDVSTGAQPKI